MKFTKNILLFCLLLPLSCGGAFAASTPPKIPLRMTPIPKTAPIKATPAYVAAVKRKARGGDATAEFNLAVLYHDGTGVTRDYQKSLDWMKKSAKDGDKDAPLNLYAIYSGGIGVTKDLKQAAAWCRRAALAGNARAAFILSDLYKKGEGVPKNLRQANVWLLRGLQENGKLKPQKLNTPARGLNKTAALLSGLTGLAVFAAIMFFYISRQRKGLPPDA